MLEEWKLVQIPTKKSLSPSIVRIKVNLERNIPIVIISFMKLSVLQIIAVTILFSMTFYFLLVYYFKNLTMFNFILIHIL